MIDEFDAGVLVRLSFSICTSYFVLRGFPPHFLPRCALRTSHFVLRTSRFSAPNSTVLRTLQFALRGSHFVLRTSRFSAPHSTVLRTLQFALRGSHFVLRTSRFCDPHSTVLRTLQFAVRTSWFSSGQTSFALWAGLHFAVHIQSTAFPV